MPPSGKCLHPIAPTAAMVNEFVETTQNTNKTHLLATTVHFECKLLMRISYPKTDPLHLSSSMRWASFKCETTRLELKSSRTFLAIKHCQGTKSKKVINSLTRIWVQKSLGVDKKLSSENEKLLLRRFPTVGIVRKVPSTQTQLPPQTSSPWWCRLPLLRRSIFGSAQSDAGNLFRRGWPRAVTLDLTKIVKITV
jgi:hypothetical protein